LTLSVAYFHYGHGYADGSGLVFSSEVVGTDLDKMFERGLKHQKNKANIKTPSEIFSEGIFYLTTMANYI
jgi:hypothetical protein